MRDILDKEKFEVLLKKVFEEKTSVLSKMVKMNDEELLGILYHAKEL